MGARTGSADLPLHGGWVPTWLAQRMARLGTVIVEALVLYEGPHGVLRRLAHPFWFQSLGCILGMDWHSSGITTSVLGALKRGLTGREDELGLTICGGRGRHSRKTPGELIALGDRTGLDGASLARTSRLVAKVDSAAVQDGFSLYLHGFVVARDGAWTVVQQGMKPEARTARRYHWLSETVRSFVEEPHAAIEGEPQGSIVNLTDRSAAASRAAQVELVVRPDEVIRELRRIPHMQLPAHHDVRPTDVFLRRVHATLAAAADCGPRDFPELLLQKGVGARTLQALAAVAEVVHGAPCRFTDPARFSLAHGGKDGHPFPVPLRVYDQTISVLKQAVSQARLGRDEKLQALRRLDEQARRIEGAVSGPSLEALIAHEREESYGYDGRDVTGPSRPPQRGQLALFSHHH
ncbi:MAG TPA: DUF763 domain-containing protein [Myxococcales bacterium]|nr:DUF763 domain-containing protein [Myxococcales bacterium]